MGSVISGNIRPDTLATQDIIHRGHQSPPVNRHIELSFLCEFLDTDLLPAFVVNLSAATYPTQRAILYHVNPALKTLTTVQAQIAGCVSAVGCRDYNGVPCQPLFDWISNARTESLSSKTGARTCLESCEFRWTATVLANEWAVVVAKERMQSRTSDHDVCDPNCLSSKSETKADRRSTVVENTHTSYTLGHIHPHGQLGNSEHLNWIRNFDWATTSFGPIRTWSSQLRQACEMMLVSPHPVALAWGSDLSIVFNEAYRPIFGEQHRSIMGRPISENWPPVVYEKFTRLLEDVKHTGVPIQTENEVRHFPRDGQMEEIYANTTMFPILTPNASVAGFWVQVIDVTKLTVFERRTRILIDLNDSLASSKSLQDVWQSIISVLGNHKSDIHFAAIYARSGTPLSSPIAPQVTLETAVGMHDDRLQLLFDTATTTETALGAAVNTALKTGSVEVLSIKEGTLSEQQLAIFAECGVEESFRHVVVYPLMADGDGSVEAALVVGICPMRIFDDDYQTFLRLLRKQCESAITVVKLIQKERALVQERATIEGEKRFKQFAERAPVGIYMYDQEGSIKFCNKAFEDMCDMTQEKLVEPMAWTRCVHPDSLDETQTYWDRLANVEGPLTFELQFKKPWTPAKNTLESLDRTWGLASCYPDVSEDGEYRGIYGCVIDISYVKWAEKIQSQRLSEALELKRQQENFLDMTSHEIRNPLNAMSHCASELVEQLSLQINSNNVLGNHTKVLGDCLNMANTITYCAKHQKRIIDDVLTVSKLDSRLLQVYPADTNPTDLLTQVLALFDSELRATEIEACTNVLQGYRDLGIVEVLLDPHRVSQVIINLLGNAIKFVQREPHRLLRLSVDASRTEPAPECGGLKYVPSGTHRQDPTGAAEWGVGEFLFLTFAVQDTGPGMSDEEAVSLFQKFAQASPRTHTTYGGSGLGLFISRELAEMHGGRIGLLSQHGSGSTFSFYVKCRRVQQVKATVPRTSVNMLVPVRLPTPIESKLPAAKLEARLPQSNTLKTDPLPSQKRRVLIVEDNIINQRLLKRLVTKHGYDTSVANHGEEALAIIQASAWCIGAQSPRLDIVLCDIEMPVMDGKSCVRRIRQLQHEGILHPSIPVVAVTGNARAEQVKSAKEAGFDTVVCKPYEPQELLALLRQILEPGHTSDKNGG